MARCGATEATTERWLALRGRHPAAPPKTVFTAVSTRRSRSAPELLGFFNHYRFR